MNKRAAVIGGGISGLCAAFKLMQAGVEVTLFESGPRVGGNIRTEVRDGFLFEHGPNSTLASIELLDLLGELDIIGEIAQPSTNAKRRYIVKGGKLAALPSGPLDLLKGDVFSAAARLRLLKEPFVRTRSPEGESVAVFFARRLGKEIVNYAVDPFISGIYAGDPHRLSMRSAFPRLFEMERDHGSLLKAGLFGKRDRSKRKVPKGTPRSITFRRGMQTLTDALESRLNGNIRLSSAVESIDAADGSYAITAKGETETFDAVIVTTPAYMAAGLIQRIDAELAALLADIYYPPVSVVFTGFAYEHVKAAAEGFGFLVPGGEKRQILGSLWTSSVFENRAPDGYHLFTTFLGGSRNAELGDKSQDELVRIAVSELDSILGLSGEPVLIAVKTWERAIPQYNIGYENVTAAIDAFSAAHPGMYLCSNYHGGISVSDCIRNAGAVAAAIAGR